MIPWARAGVGTVATQSLSNTRYGGQGLELMARGATAEETLRIITRDDPDLAMRQLGMVDAQGRAASFTGAETFDWAGGRVGYPDGRGSLAGGKGQMLVGRSFAAQGNLLASDRTVANMAETFEQSQGELVERLLAALKAGQAGGGDRRGMQSAALLVVRKEGGYLGLNDRYVDIRVYDAPDPIAELERLLRLYKLYFFPSEAQDLIDLAPEVIETLESILLAEPVRREQKWLAVPQGVANHTLLEALRNFMYWENYDMRVRMDGKIDRVVMADILAKREPH
ncbi:MAG: DUF1028 domain-containing protein [Candidatus Competibacteraceae bacterium]